MIKDTYFEIQPTAWSKRSNISELCVVWSLLWTRRAFIISWNPPSWTTTSREARVSAKFHIKLRHAMSSNWRESVRALNGASRRRKSNSVVSFMPFSWLRSCLLASISGTWCHGTRQEYATVWSRPVISSTADLCSSLIEEYPFKWSFASSKSLKLTTTECKRWQRLVSCSTSAVAKYSMNIESSFRMYMFVSFCEPTSRVVSWNLSVCKHLGMLKRAWMNDCKSATVSGTFSLCRNSLPVDVQHRTIVTSSILFWTSDWVDFQFAAKGYAIFGNRKFRAVYLY